MRVPFRSVTFEGGLWADYMPWKGSTFGFLFVRLHLRVVFGQIICLGKVQHAGSFSFGYI